MLSVFCINILAQIPAQTITEQDLQSFSEGRTFVKTNINALYEGVKGTPYFNDEWLTGDVYFQDTTEINKISIRYNIYTDELEFINNTSGQVFVINSDKISGFRFHEPENPLYFKYMSLKPKKPDEKSFFQILYEGKTRLLLKHKKQFIQADYKGAYASGNKYDEYKDDKIYYLVKDDEPAQRIKLTNKSVLSALEDDQPVLKEYASDNKIDCTNPEDIIRLLKFYDNQ